jgi:tRNA(fMet)-specific endonuclease VapC
MPKYLLDTNACIALRHHLKGNASRDAARRSANERLIARWKGMAATDLAMSLFTLGELRVFVEKHEDPGVRSRAAQVLDELCNRVSVLEQPGHDAAQGGPRALAHHYAAIRASLERQGQGIGPNDTWIAAHARVHGLTVVTQNTAEFARVPGLSVEDWTA